MVTKNESMIKEVKNLAFSVGLNIKKILNITELFVNRTILLKMIFRIKKNVLLFYLTLSSKQLCRVN